MVRRKYVVDLTETEMMFVGDAFEEYFEHLEKARIYDHTAEEKEETDDWIAGATQVWEKLKNSMIEEEVEEMKVTEVELKVVVKLRDNQIHPFDLPRMVAEAVDVVDEVEVVSIRKEEE